MIVMNDYCSWKNYQKKLQRQDLRKKMYRRGLWAFLPLALLVLGIQFSDVHLSVGSFTNALGKNRTPGDESEGRWHKKDFCSLVDPQTVVKGFERPVDVTFQGTPCTLVTTIDTEFQEFMSKRLGRTKAPLTGFVAMDPLTGQVLSLVESKKTTGAKGVCLSSRFPAASIFKIVSAAAAIDGCDLSAESRLDYNGRKHTLYKNQLTERKNRYTTTVTLKDSFAQSINPAFGKLGVFRLKKGLLEEYAERFGFNQSIVFELPLEPSRFSVDDEPYEWAEMASGFNRKTVISPLHAAMMAAAIVNDGRMVEPTIVKRMTSNENQPVYEGDSSVIRQVVSPATSREMKKLMMATISNGTSSRAFRGYSRDRVLSKLVMGGKTGSIKNRTDEFLYDWFVGFAEEKNGDRKLAIAVLVVHDQLLRARAQEFARLAFRHYFKDPPGRS